MGYLSKSSDKAKSSQNNALGQVDGVPIQAKMRYGEPGDSYEQEADRVADAVVANTSSKTNSNTAASPALGSGISNYVQREAEPKAGGEEEKKQEEQPAQKKEEKKEEEKSAQKKEDKKEEEKPAQKKEEKKEEEKPAQKKEGKKEEEKPAQKKEGKKEEEKPAQKKEGKKEEEKPAQKKEGKKEEEKPAQKKEDKKEEEKPAQKKEGKKEEEKPAQKKEAKKEEEKSAQKKEGKKEEEKPAQKKEAKKEEEKPAQKKSTDKKEEEKKVQKKEAKKEEEKPAQKKESDHPKAEEPDIERDILASKNAGKPMEDDVRKEMEKQFSKDFKNVRIHNDAASYEMCRKINAQAFAHGSHIYFAEGKYDPQSTEGKRLLAHELTHVVQQGNEVKRKMVQKTDGTTSTTKVDITTGALRGAYVDTGASEIKIPDVGIPNFKQRHSDAYSSGLEYQERPSTSQDTKWRQEVEPGVQAKLERKKAEAEARGAKNASGTYFFKGRRRNALRLIGREGGFSSSSGDRRTSLLETFIFPIWDRSQEPATFQVDHRKEMQLKGEDVPSNYELLEAAANSSSGSLIRGSISGKINSTLAAAKALAPGNTTLQSLNETTVKASYKIIFERARFNLAASGDGSKFWRVDQIRSGNHMDDIIPMSPREIEELGDRTNPKVFSSPAGGTILNASGPYPKRNWMPRVDLLQVIQSSDGSSLSGIVVRAYKAGDTREPGSVYAEGDSANNMTWNLIPIEGVYGGAIDKTSIEGTLRNSLRLPGLSPIELHSVDLLEGRGIMARGKVLPTVPLIRNADIDILITGAEVQLRKTFNAGEFSLPSPFRLNNVALTVFLSTSRGLGVEGRVDFEIQNVGQGFIGAEASTGGGFALEGEFNFDSTLFEPARVRVTYRNEQWSITGQIGIPQGKVRGIKRGTITLTYESETLTAQGEIEPDIKGIQRGTMNARFNEAGFLISGDFVLSNEIPGIRGGQLSATLEKTGDEYKVKASGTAQPAIPGVDATLTIEYDNGALKIEGSAAYQRGLLSGNIHVGATNRAIGADGQPSGDPTDTFTVYGGGELTVRITPWLQGTIGVNFLPNGEMEVTGRIGIPSPIDVFSRKEVPERDVFSIGLDIPIFAIPLGPRSIGLKATIGGALKVYAGIGPGRLEQLELGITYNPDRPDDAHVTGTGRFVIPADAGLKLAVRASIGVDAGVAGVEGGIEVAGGIGLQAEAAASVTIDWTPNTGLELNATLSADVQPKFTFNIDGFIRAWVLFWEDEWRYRFANYEYGSNLNFGVSLPIHYKEGEAFDISMDQIEFRKPDIDAESFVGGILRDLA